MGRLIAHFVWIPVAEANEQKTFFGDMLYDGGDNVAEGEDRRPNWTIIFILNKIIQ
jgi:hypothetical protein